MKKISLLLIMLIGCYHVFAQKVRIDESTFLKEVLNPSEYIFEGSVVSVQTYKASD